MGLPYSAFLSDIFRKNDIPFDNTNSKYRNACTFMIC